MTRCLGAPQHMRPQAKRAITQAAAKAVAAPKLIGTDVDVHLKVRPM